MFTELKNIAPFISKQFPAFYQEEGPNFIQFVQAYYEWLDQQGPIYKTRNLFETRDIDTTGQDYINYFITKYMRGIPQNILADKKLLEKHILDIYRAKGSIEGLKLLFKLLYNMEINVHLPDSDVLKASDGKWVRSPYIEVESRTSNKTYEKKQIYGSTSGAVATVVNYSKINLADKTSDVFHLSDVSKGPTGVPFQIGEYLLYNGLDINQATKIKGSVVSANVVGSSEYNNGGDLLTTNSTSGDGLAFNVSTTIDPNFAKGYITFQIIDGGYGFTTNSVVTVGPGGNSTGQGATFKVKQIIDNTSFTYNTNHIAPESSKLLRATSWGANLQQANIQSVISNALIDQNITIGRILQLGSVDPGDHNYNGSVTPNVLEPRIYGYGIHDANGNIWGNNAVITGTLSSGIGVIKTVELVSSGLGFNIPGENVLFTNQNNVECTAVLSLNLGAVGYEEGVWTDSSGFLNSDKYITDSYYYQQYAYEIQIEKSLDKYIDVLKQIMHPVGNRVFGQPVITDSNTLIPTIDVDTLSIKYSNGTIITR